MNMEKKSRMTLLYRLREEKKMRLKGGIYHQTQVKLAYNSNHMEGSRLTEEQTRYIYETNTIGISQEPANVDDIIETVNHFQCFDYILDHAEEDLTQKLIRDIHAILKSNTSDSHLEWFRVGDYKQRPNMVGDSKTTPPGRVQKEMEKLLLDYGQKETVLLKILLNFIIILRKFIRFRMETAELGACCCLRNA